MEEKSIHDPGRVRIMQPVGLINESAGRLISVGCSMRRIVTTNLAVGLTLILGAVVLVILETLVLANPPSSFWFLALVAGALVAFLLVNRNNFKQPSSVKRGIAILSVSGGCWAISIVAAVVIGVNVKFALGGHP